MLLCRRIVNNKSVSNPRLTFTKLLFLLTIYRSFFFPIKTPDDFWTCKIGIIFISLMWIFFFFISRKKRRDKANNDLLCCVTILKINRYLSAWISCSQWDWDYLYLCNVLRICWEQNLKNIRIQTCFKRK